MQKAFAWLDKHNITYTFHDYKKQGVMATTLEAWCKKESLEKLINTKGLTYKKLSDEQKVSMRHPSKAIQILVAQPSMIKRPILESNNVLILGFDEIIWSAILK